MNKATIIWYITAKPEMKSVWNNNVSNISVATTEKRKDSNGELKERTTFHNVTLWGQQAKYACEYADKWDLVLIEWKINNDEWTDENEKKRITTKIISNNFSILRSKNWRSEQWSSRTQSSDDMDIPF